MKRIPLLDMLKLSLNLPSVLFKVSVGEKHYVGQIASIKVGDIGIEMAELHFRPYLMEPEFAPIELLPDEYDIVDIIDTKASAAGKILIDLFETENKLNALQESSNTLLNQYFKELKDGFEKLNEYHPELKLGNAMNYLNEIIQETEFKKIFEDVNWKETFTIDVEKTDNNFSIVSLLKQS